MPGCSPLPGGHPDQRLSSAGATPAAENHVINPASCAHRMAWTGSRLQGLLLSCAQVGSSLSSMPLCSSASMLSLSLISLQAATVLTPGRGPACQPLVQPAISNLQGPHWTHLQTCSLQLGACAHPTVKQSPCNNANQQRSQEPVANIVASLLDDKSMHLLAAMPYFNLAHVWEEMFTLAGVQTVL